MTTTAKTTEPRVTVKRGFSVPCLKCNELTVSIALTDVTTFHCESCESKYSLDDVLDTMARWDAVLRWIRSAPEVTE
jgi:transcription elongation factor Elf1